MVDPLVSVIVASYNNGPYLSDMIASVLGQTYTNWELVITDDASDDDSVAIVTNQMGDPRIVLCRHTENLGAGAAFKTSMDHSRGEIIAMLGADDALQNNALAVMVEEHCRHPEAGMVVGGLLETDNQLNITGQRVYQGPFGKNTTILEQGWAFGWDTFKRRFYNQTQGFENAQKRAVDQDLYFKMEAVAPVVFVPHFLYMYRQNANGISQGPNRTTALWYHVRAMEHAVARLPDPGQRVMASLKQMRHKYHLMEAIVNFYDKDYSKMRKNVVQSLLLCPQDRLFLKINLLLHPLKFWKK